MSEKIPTRMGDGERIWMTPSEIKDDIQGGTADAARRAKIPELGAEEQEKLFAIMAEPSRIVSVEPGQEVIVSDDILDKIRAIIDETEMEMGIKIGDNN